MQNTINSSIIDSGKINEYLHLVDVKQFGMERVLTIFIAEFDDGIIIIDCGTSFEINRLLRYMKKNQLSLSAVKYIIPTHFHFDHCGGLWKLYEKIKVANQNVKILSSAELKHQVNNFDNLEHFSLAKKTFGGLIGELKGIDDSAFEIITPDDSFGEKNFTPHPIKVFKLGDKNVNLAIFKTPGHSLDHVCPLFIINGKLAFIHFGEALGIKGHKDKLITAPNCAAPNFDYKLHMNSAEKLNQLNPQNAGFSHSGFVHGEKNIRCLMIDHLSLMEQFRNMIVEYYKEKPETKFVFEKIYPFLKTRSDLGDDFADNPTVRKMMLTAVYGMMTDLKYR